MKKMEKEWYEKWWVWVIIVIAYGFLRNGYYNSDKVSNNNKPNIEQQKVMEITSVESAVLYKDYMDNAIAADKKYKDKILKLSGSVKDIDRAIFGEAYVTFEMENYGEIMVKFKKTEEDNVAQLKKGQNITIVGRCTGLLMTKTVELDKCTLQ